MSVSSIKQAKVRELSSKPIPQDWDEEACLCQGQVPDDKRIDVQQRVFDEKRQKWRWKSLVRYHQDCPIHGCNKENVPCHAA